MPLPGRAAEPSCLLRLRLRPVEDRHIHLHLLKAKAVRTDWFRHGSPSTGLGRAAFYFGAGRNRAAPCRVGLLAGHRVGLARGESPSDP